MADQNSPTPATAGTTAGKDTLIAIIADDPARIGSDAVRAAGADSILAVISEGTAQPDWADEVLHIPGGTPAGIRQFRIIDHAKRAGFAKLLIVPVAAALPGDAIEALGAALDDADVVIASPHNGNPSGIARRLLETDFDVTSSMQGFALTRLPDALLGIIGGNIVETVMLLPLVAEYNGHPVRQIRIAADGNDAARTVRPPLIRLTALAMQMKMAKAQFRHVEPFTPPADAPSSEEQVAWDSYWTHGSHSGKWVYDLIAAFYRAFIIRPAVNAFLFKNFPEGAKLVHAGCGSGMVDVDVARKMHITALDISPAGLTEYSRHHEHSDLMLGSIFEMPIADESYDGLFNLGVMEHFHTHELDLIIPEINRVLKPGGRAVLFWPPQWGLSVNVLRVVHWLLHSVMKSEIELHPPEYTRVKSKAQILRWCDLGGFKLKQFYFGPRDLFTHQIVVLEKVTAPKAAPKAA